MSRQAGHTIRGEDLRDNLARRALLPSPILSINERIGKWLIRRGLFNPNTRLGRLAAAVGSPIQGLESASRQIAEGNKKVFEEIGREFARFLATRASDTTRDDTALETFCATLRPGPPPDGQDRLKEAFRHYYAAKFTADPIERAQLEYLANVLVGFHEQIRLQAQIESGRTAPIVDEARWGVDLVTAIFTGATRWWSWLRTSLGAVLRVVLRPARDAILRLVREVVTEELMTLTVAGQRYSLARAISLAVPTELQKLTNCDLVAVMASLPAPVGASGDVGAMDWADFGQRMRYIAYLFRVYHRRADVCDSPLTVAQIAGIRPARYRMASCSSRREFDIGAVSIPGRRCIGHPQTPNAISRSRRSVRCLAYFIDSIEMPSSKLVAYLPCIAIIATSAFAQRGAPPPVVDPAATIDVVVRPVRNGSPDVQYAEVREQIVRSPGTTSADFSVLVPGGPPGPAPDGLDVLEMSDQQGSVPVRADSNSRRWRAQRPVTFPVTLTFRARMWPPGTRTNPSYMLRSSDGAVSGQGTGILVTPADGVNYAGRFHWDLSDLAPGSITTSGITDENDVRAPLSQLSGTFFMAGPLHRYPMAGERDGFVAYWHGSPTWDGQITMAWVASMYEYMRKFWGETEPRRYRVMGRMFPPPAIGGTALPNHFIFNAPSGPRDTSDRGPLLLLAHETGHLFVRGLQNPGGGGPSNNWFTEGLNEYYAVTLALRSGLAPLDLVLQEINMQTRNYYTNPRRNMPADSVAMFNPMIDGRAQNVSYERGILFWADMDARIRAASKGRRSLDNVFVPLITRARTLGGEGQLGGQARQGGQPGWFTAAELVDSLAKEAGPAARQMFDSVIVRGKTIVPVSNAFGPCFELKPARIPDRYLGAADPRTLAAGLPEIDAYLWSRVASVPDSKCRAW